MYGRDISRFKEKNSIFEQIYTFEKILQTGRPLWMTAMILKQKWQVEWH